MINKKFLVLIFLTGIIFSLNFFSAYLSSSPQTSSISNLIGGISQSACEKGQDFLVQVTPFGCTPAVVRSDLLDENNVPVYCSLAATQVNPLINIKSIDSISFSGKYSPQVSGVGFYPAKAALGVQGNLNSPALNNIGYVVINLKKQANESAMPDFISGNLTAKIKYNINNAFGIGNALFYLPEFASDSDWQNAKNSYSFWSGKGFLRADNINNNGADVSVYVGDQKISQVSLKKGETSNSISLPGFECQAGLKLKLNDIQNPDTRARLRVDADVVEVGNGEKFLNNKCSVQNLKNNGLVQQVTIKCQDDSGTKTNSLSISPAVKRGTVSAWRLEQVGTT